MKEIEISIYSIVGNELCVDAEDGEAVFNVLKKALEQDNKVVISFLNVEMLTSAFLNVAIGRLYGHFDYDKIKSSISVKDISPDDKLLLKKVTDTAKAYYQNPQKIEKIESEILDE